MAKLGSVTHWAKPENRLKGIRKDTKILKKLSLMMQSGANSLMA